MQPVQVRPASLNVYHTVPHSCFFVRNYSENSIYSFLHFLFIVTLNRLKILVSKGKKSQDSLLQRAISESTSVLRDKEKHRLTKCTTEPILGVGEVRSGVE